MRTASVDRVRV